MVLAAAKTDEDRTTLLAQKKELISVELVRGLNEHGRRIKQNDTARALGISPPGFPFRGTTRIRGRGRRLAAQHRER